MNRKVRFLIVAFLIIITITPAIIIGAYGCTENSPRYFITIDEVNGQITSAPLPPLSNPVQIEGRVNSKDYAGHISQYQVQVDWGDGTIDTQSEVKIDRDGIGFEGTWHNNPDHTYSVSGEYTVRVKLYHQMPPGAESADAEVSLTIFVEVEPEVIIAEVGESVTIATYPSGLGVTVDGSDYIAPQVFSWPKFSTHDISTFSPQLDTIGTRYVWYGWSDNGAISHSVTANWATIPDPSTATISLAFFGNLPTTFDIFSTLSNVASGAIVTNGEYVGYCIGWGNGVPTGTVNLYSSLDASLPSDFNSMPWGKINYILNHVPAGATSGDIQQAIWYFALGLNPSGSTYALQMIAAADVNGGFIPSAVDSLAVICDPVSEFDSSGQPLQNTIIQVFPAYSITAYFNIQHYLTVQTSPFDLVSISGSGWNEEGSSVTLNAPAIQGHDFQYWDVDGTQQGTFNQINILMDAPHTATAHYSPNSDPSPSPSPTPDVSPSAQTVIIVFAKPSLASAFTGTILTVDGVDYDNTQLPAIFSWDIDSVHNFAYSSSLTSGTTRDIWNSTAGLTSLQSGSITAIISGTVTANYQSQYYLAVQNGGYGTASGSNWYDAGSQAGFSITPTTWSTTTSTQQAFGAWSGASASANPSDTIIMNMPATVTATWKTQHYLNVVSSHGGPSGSGWYDESTTAYASLNQGSEDIAQGTRVTFTNWTGDASGTTLRQPVIMNSPKTVTAGWKTQHYLTVTTNPPDVISLNPSAVSGAGWYDQATNATITALKTVQAGSSPIYTFVSWTGVQDANAKADQTAVVMDTPKTVTANYATQGSSTYQNLTILTDPEGITTIPGAGQYIQGAAVNLNAPPLNNYVFAYWDIDGSSQGANVNPITVIMNSDHEATAHYTLTNSPTSATALMVTFDQTGVGVDFAGTIVIIDGVAYGKEALPAVFEWDVNSVHSFAYASSLNVGDKRYAYSSTSGLSSVQSGSLTVTQSGTVNAIFSVQYRVTFVQTGLDLSAIGTVVTIAGSPKALNSLPHTENWVNSGSAISFAYSVAIQSFDSGKQFRLESTSNTSPLTVTAPVTVIGNYRTQYLITFDQTGLDSSASGQVLTVDGSVKSFGDLRFQKWVDSGSTVSYSYSTQVSAGSNKQFTLNGVSGPASGFTVIAATTIVGSYRTQYQVTFSQNGLDSSATSAVVNIAGSSRTFGGLPFTTNWVDAGSQLSYSYQNIIESSTNGKRFELANVQGPSSPIIVNNPSNIVGVYSEKLYLNVISSFGDPQGGGWYTANSVANFGVGTPVDQGNRTLRVLLNWLGDVNIYEPSGSIIMTKPSTVTASWETQYLITFNTTLPNLTVLSVPGVPTTLPPGLDVFGAYYPAGGLVEAGPAPTAVSGADATNFILRGWTLDAGSLSSEDSVSFVVDGPRDVAVVFGTTHLLTINAIGVTDPFEASVTITASPPVTLSLTPSSPAKNWLPQGADTLLAITTANKIGHGEWAIFGEWTGQSGQVAKELTFTMNAPTSLDAAFSKVNPVAQSLPYSTIAGLVSIGLMAWAVRKKKTSAWRTRLAIATGAVIVCVALAIAASVSTTVAVSNGINAAELVDFTNWAVIFLAIEALAFMIGSTLLVRKLQRKNPPHLPQNVPPTAARTGFVQH